jgi:hypothetical protein
MRLSFFLRQIGIGYNFPIILWKKMVLVLILIPLLVHIDHLCFILSTTRVPLGTSFLWYRFPIWNSELSSTLKVNPRFGVILKLYYKKLRTVIIMSWANYLESLSYWMKTHKWLYIWFVGCTCPLAQEPVGLEA